MSTCTLVHLQCKYKFESTFIVLQYFSAYPIYLCLYSSTKSTCVYLRSTVLGIYIYNNFNYFSYCGYMTLLQLLVSIFFYQSAMVYILVLYKCRKKAKHKNCSA